MNANIESIVDEIEKVIVGKREVILKVLMAILSKGNILLDDVPGVGKTTLALSVAKTIGIESKRIQMTPDVVPSDIVGFSIFNKAEATFSYQQGAVMTNLLLADEINRTSSKTQSALLEAMEEKQVTVDGVVRKLPNPFNVIATQNPVGSAGTQLLPNSQLDRFMIKTQMGYPDVESQVNILRDRLKNKPIDNVVSVVSRDDLLKMQDDVENVQVNDEILRYAADLAMATRKNDMIRLGVSPRGVLAIINMAKACAFVSGRDYVVPEDIQNIFVDVCGHRIILGPKAKIEKINENEVLTEIMEMTKAPDSGR